MAAFRRDAVERTKPDHGRFRGAHEISSDFVVAPTRFGDEAEIKFPLLGKFRDNTVLSLIMLKCGFTGRDAARPAMTENGPREGYRGGIG